MRRQPNPSSTQSTSLPKVGTQIELTVTTLDEEGYGLSRIEGKDFLVIGALPGETVRARVTHVGRRHSFAVATKILRRAPARLVSLPCTVRDCDGCPLIAMNYPSQLAWKKDFVAGQLGRYSSLGSVILHPVLPSPTTHHYRNTAKLVVSGKFAAPVIGIYQRNTHEVIDLTNCPLHHHLINKIVTAVRDGIRKGKVPIFSQRTGSGLLRYIVIRVSETTNQAMLVFVTSHRSYNEIHHLAKFVQSAVPEVTVVAQNVNSSEGNVILGDKDHFLTKQKALPADIGQEKFTLSPRSFFQVNSGAAALIYETVREWAGLTGRERVIDLYCGIGGISFFLAGKALEVIGIEVVEEAVADAGRNSRLNRTNNCRFMAGDAAELLEELLEEGERTDIIVLNPPRKGCDRQVLEKTSLLKPEKIIYVSCSPVTLARDLDILAGLGYRTQEIQPVDMFPQTTHVENVALLIRD